MRVTVPLGYPSSKPIPNSALATLSRGQRVKIFFTDTGYGKDYTCYEIIVAVVGTATSSTRPAHSTSRSDPGLTTAHKRPTLSVTGTARIPVQPVFRRLRRAGFERGLWRHSAAPIHDAAHFGRRMARCDHDSSLRVSASDHSLCRAVAQAAHESMPTAECAIHAEGPRALGQLKPPGPPHLPVTA